MAQNAKRAAKPSAAALRLAAPVRFFTSTFVSRVDEIDEWIPMRVFA